MDKRPQPPSPPPFILWPVLVGAAGFVAGFFGPIALNPDANQGPLAGIFITGPAGFMLGLLLGAVFKVFPLPVASGWKVLLGTAAAMGLGTLWFVLPEPERIGDVIEAQVAGCHDASEAMPEAIAYWDKRIAAVTWAPPRTGWRANTPRMLADDPGVILDLQLARTNTIVRHRKPWNSGRVSAGGWHDAQETKSYFARYAGASCEDYPTGTTARYFPKSEDTPAEWPPTNLPTFLDKQVLGPVPAAYSSLVAD